MPVPELVILDSPQAIRAVAAEWDDLWRRSDCALPVARAELTAQWLENFAARTRVACLVVRKGEQLVAALPLAGGRWKKLLAVGRLPSNAWAWAGDLLVDPAADREQIARLLVAGIRRLPWPLLRLEGAALDSSRWQLLIDRLHNAGLLVAVDESFAVGQVDIDHDWTAYQASWPGNHRRQMGKMLRRAEREGGVELKVVRQFGGEDIEALLTKGFQVEDRGWKGAAGSSVWRNPSIFRFFCAQARQLAQQGNLQLTFLEHRGRTIAFEYGWNVGGVYGSAKVGYDEQFAELSPGQLLRYLLLERMFADPEQHRFDFLGPLTPATDRWSTSTYRIGRIVASTGGLVGRLCSRLYRLRRREPVGSRQEAVDSCKASVEA